MEKQNISKEQLIKGWKKACKIAKNDTYFNTQGSTDGILHVLKIEEGMNLEISTQLNYDKSAPTPVPFYKYFISILFDDVISYCILEIEEKEYKELTDLFHQRQLNERQKTKEKIIKNYSQKLKQFLN